MVDESKDYLFRAQREAQLRFGKTLTADELALKFSQHGLDARIEHLSNLDSSDETQSVRAAAERLTYVRKLREVHEKLRRVGR